MLFRVSVLLSLKLICKYIMNRHIIGIGINVLHALFGECRKGGLQGKILSAAVLWFGRNRHGMMDKQDLQKPARINDARHSRTAPHCQGCSFVMNPSPEKEARFSASHPDSVGKVCSTLTDWRSSVSPLFLTVSRWPLHSL